MNLTPRAWQVLIALIISGLGAAPSIYAQVRHYNGFMRTDLVSPTPTAASLGKYGNLPVNYYTGLPNVSIPIFEAEGIDLKIPIALTYNSNGFKPSETPSWVGLGWALQAGGVITRSIGDKVDEHFGNYQKNPNVTQLGTQSYLKAAYKQALHDLKPDIYRFNFAGYSGKFIWYQGQAYCTNPKLKISGPGSGSITITTEDGTKYRFEESELSADKQTGYEPYIMAGYRSAWYLTMILSPSGKECIRLEYANEGPIYNHGIMTQSYLKYMGLGGGQTSTLESPGASFTTHTDIAKRLTAIYTSKYLILFNVGYVRPDVSGIANSLGGISVYSLVGGTSKLIKQFKFDTDYWGSSSKYMRLKRLVEYDSAKTDSLVHGFEYENESTFYANKYGSYVDCYGYLKSPSVMPGTPIPVYFPDPIYQGGPNRDPELSSAKQGALKKITYPTGGTSVLEYDLNTYYNGVAYNYSYIVNDAAKTPTRTSGTPQNQSVTQSDTFAINYDQSVDLSISRSQITNTGDTQVAHSGTYDVQLSRLTLDESGNIDLITPIATYRIMQMADNGGKIFPINLTSGAYQITVVCDITENWVSAYISGKKRYIVSPIEGAPGAGVRIKKITENPVIGTPIVRNYSYANDDGFSTGQGLGEKAYSGIPYTKKVKQLNGTPLGEWTYIDYTSMLGESSIGSLPFYYTRVTEDVQSGNAISRTRYHYQNISGLDDADLVLQTEYKQENNTFTKIREVENVYGVQGIEAFGGASIFRTMEEHTEGIGDADPEVTYDWSGSLDVILWKYHKSTKETVFEDQQQLVTETINFYDVNATKNLVGVKKKNSDGSSLYTKYKYPEQYASTLTSNLTANGIRSVVLEEQTWKKASPASLDSALISGTVQNYNSSGKVTAIYAAEPATRVTTLTNETNSNGEYSSLLPGSGLYKQKIEFQYDNLDRLISQVPAKDLATSYIWGYQQSSLVCGPVIQGNAYPIAEVKNATPSQVFYTSFEHKTSSSIVSTSAKTGKYAHNGSYQILGTYSGKYKLTYWKKTGSADWVLIESYITTPNNIWIGDSNSLVDEVRLVPEKATLTTYTYLHGVGFSAVTDENNFITYYEYDKFGRLSAIRDHNRNILKTYAYNVKH